MERHRYEHVKHFLLLKCFVDFLPCALEEAERAEEAVEWDHTLQLKE